MNTDPTNELWFCHNKAAQTVALPQAKQLLHSLQCCVTDYISRSPNDRIPTWVASEERIQDWKEDWETSRSVHDWGVVRDHLIAEDILFGIVSTLLRIGCISIKWRWMVVWTPRPAQTVKTAVKTGPFVDLRIENGRQDVYGRAWEGAGMLSTLPIFPPITCRQRVLLNMTTDEKIGKWRSLVICHCWSDNDGHLFYVFVDKKELSLKLCITVGSRCSETLSLEPVEQGQLTDLYVLLNVPVLWSGQACL